MLLVLNGSGRSPADLRAMTSMAVGELKAQHGTLFAVVANRVDEAAVIEDVEAITVPGRAGLRPARGADPQRARRSRT